MPAEVFVPQGERETLGIVKETTFNTFPGGTGMIWHAFSDYSGKVSNMPVQRNPRSSMVSPYPGTGGREGTGSLSPETDGDTFGQILAFSMGSQTNPSGNIVATTTVGTALTAATTFTVASAVNIFPGMTITVQGNPASVVKSVSNKTITVTTGLTGGAGPGATVVCTSASAAYASTIKHGTPLPTFSIQLNRPGSIATDDTGCKVESLSLSMSAKAGLQAKVGIAFAQRTKDGSPVAATLSTKQPIIFEQQAVPPVITGTGISGSLAVLGAGTEATVLSASVSVSNNLTKGYFGLGGGNLVRSFPEGLRKVSGTMTLGFETSTLFDAFQAALNGGALPSFDLLIPLASTDLADATLGIPYAVTLYLPKLFLSSHDIGDKTTGPLQQTVAFEAAESAAGANDALTIYYIGTASTAY